MTVVYDLPCAHKRRQKIGHTEWTDAHGIVYRHALCRECFHKELRENAEAEEPRWQLDGWTLRARAEDFA